MRIYTVGGYNKVGKNMTVIESGDEMVILDMGFDMEAVSSEDEPVEEWSTREAMEAGVIPNDKQIYDRREKVKAIVIGHGHLDHVGAAPKIAGAYDCPILATPYTMKVLARRADEDSKQIKNKRITLQAGEKHWVSDRMEVEFIHVTHSIPDSVLTAVHTPEGTVLYCLDFRLDDAPQLGMPTDYERLRELGGQNVRLLIGDSTRVMEPGGGESETQVKEELQQALDDAYHANKGVIVTTFSSHIERIRSILAVNQNRRKVAFLGRSLKEYTKAAEELGWMNLSAISVVSRFEETNDLLRQIEGEREEWLIVCTGNQGEPRSALTRIAAGDYEFGVHAGDHIIFSSSVIPTPRNRRDRVVLEEQLNGYGATLKKDIHASGHAKREDNRRMLQLVKPQNVLPAHGSLMMKASFAELAREEGYTLNENLFLCEDGNVLEL